MLYDISFIILLAQDDAGRQNPVGMFLLTMVIPIFFLYIFLVQRPAIKREQQMREEMIGNLKKNDRILTTGGIYGVVTNVQLDADEVTIRVDETTNTKIKVTRSAIHRVLSGDGKDKDKDTA